MTSKNTFYAVHIGVDVYAHDSVPPLSGTTEDARRWQRYTTHTDHLDAPDDHVKVLVGVDATRQGILAAVEWLGEQVGTTGSGLVTFSGHGTALETQGAGPTAALCPYDVDPDDVGSVLSIGEVEEAIGAEASPNVTVVLDASYTKGRRSPARSIRMGRRAVHQPDSAMRLLVAASPWQEARDVEIGGVKQGAFTFALLTLLERWGAVHPPSGDVWVPVTYGDLMYRTQDLLDVLGVEQQPVLLGDRRLPMVPFLRHGYELANGLTLTRPTPDTAQIGFGSGTQLRYYKLHIYHDGSRKHVASIYVTGPTEPVLPKQTEFWFPEGTVDASQIDTAGYQLEFVAQYDKATGSGMPAPTTALFIKPCLETYDAWNQPPNHTSSKWLPVFFNGPAGDRIGLTVRLSSATSTNATFAGVCFYSNNSTTSIQSGDESGDVMNFQLTNTAAMNYRLKQMPT